MKREITEGTPFEDLRKQALEHYHEASKAISHWSSFVESAIKAYNPLVSHPEERPLPARTEQENHDTNCFHECPYCNSRCNCNSHPCSCCEQEPQSERT